VVRWLAVLGPWPLEEHCFWRRSVVGGLLRWPQRRVASRLSRRGSSRAGQGSGGACFGVAGSRAERDGQMSPSRRLVSGGSKVRLWLP